MIIKTCDGDTAAYPSISRASVPSLRLVVGGIGESRNREELVDDRALPCAVLKSAIADKTPIILSVLTDLFKSLRQGERIAFVHRVIRSASGKAEGLRSIVCRVVRFPRLLRGV